MQERLRRTFDESRWKASRMKRTSAEELVQVHIVTRRCTACSFATRLVLGDGRVDFDRSRTVRRTSRCCGCRCSIIADLPLRVAQISHMERRSRRGGKLLWRRMLGQRVQLTSKRSRVANSATRGVTRHSRSSWTSVAGGRVSGSSSCYVCNQSLRDIEVIRY